jgi:pSer/pThr/pTyr-binding forkhead associated (FHA) protein
VHIIDFTAQDQIKVGRGHDCEIRITDISVSRLHAYIKKNPETGEFVTEDNKSKFGTLVLIKKPFMMQPHTTNMFQIGRSLVEMTVHLPKSHELLKDPILFPELNLPQTRNRSFWCGKCCASKQTKAVKPEAKKLNAE